MKAVLERAARLNSLFDCGAMVGEEAVVPCGDPAYEVLEHICHEMAHAALLGVPLGQNLSSRIDQHIRKLPWEERTDNEAETFAVVMRVFKALGLKVDRAVMADAAEVQVEWGYTEIYTFWRAFETTDRCEAAAQTLLATLLEEQT